MAAIDEVRRRLGEMGSALGRLSPRERGLLGLVAGATIVLFIVVTAVSMSRAVDRRLSRIAVKAKQLEEVAQLTQGYAAAERERTDLERRLRGSSVRLFTMVEELCKKLGVEMAGMSDKGVVPLGDGKISESSVEVSLMRVGLDGLTRVLSELESGQGLIKVKRLQVRPRADEKVFDAWIVVTTYQLSG